MSVEFCVISIGTLSRNRLWGEGAAVRTGHATTTYIETPKRRILVDPSLPGAILAARFNERTGKTLDDVTDVFLTTLRPVHRRAIEAFANAKWWTGELELLSYQRHLEGLLESAARLSSEDAELARADLKLLKRFAPAPDSFAEQVSLFPLPGASVGSAGLLLSPPTMTVTIAGDAALTGEHVERGQVWEGCADSAAALESLQELLEVSDVIVPGHDNLILTPRRSWL
ncbi:MAG: MBL fold metallo-hydrolase [Planctomycetota bacterium]|jgi:glyoxylase-like metal-dependent hydrolase (beta-lactamase superfamily II)